ncbi:MAG: ribonuclease III [Lachnospiraceae bacterium]|nr:ribonuclease III [Lachnospiraceae bacterium]
MKKKLEELSGRIGYEFREEALFVHAMTHSTYSNEKGYPKTGSNERLEFLGDAVLEICSSDYLYHMYPEMEEGELSKLRASIVCEPTLADLARSLKIGDCLLLGKGEEKTGGRFRDSILSDAVEALIGAIYLDGGFANAKEFVDRFVMDDIEHKKLFYDSKTILQEMVQGWESQSNAKEDHTLKYELISEEGPDHAKVFTAQVRIGETIYATGKGSSKKGAEQKAAYETILLLKKR